MPKDTVIGEPQNLGSEAQIAFQEAVDEVVLEHQRLGLPLYIMRDGKVIAISAEEALRENSQR